jgi:hypothetical protein
MPTGGRRTVPDGSPDPRSGTLRQAEDISAPDLSCTEFNDPGRQRVANLVAAPSRRDNAIAVARDEKGVMSFRHVCPLCRAAAISFEGVQSIEIDGVGAPEHHVADVIRHRCPPERRADHHEFTG